MSVLQTIVSTCEMCEQTKNTAECCCYGIKESRDHVSIESPSAYSITTASLLHLNNSQAKRHLDHHLNPLTPTSINMGKFTNAIKGYWKPVQPVTVGNDYSRAYGSGLGLFDKRPSYATTMNSRSNSFTDEELEHLNSRLDGFSSDGRYRGSAFFD